MLGNLPKNMALYGTVPPFQDPEIPVDRHSIDTKMLYHYLIGPCHFADWYCLVILINVFRQEKSVCIQYVPSYRCSLKPCRTLQTKMGVLNGTDVTPWDIPFL